MGRTAFTRNELSEIKRLLGEIRRTDRSRQKSLRGRLRRDFDFYITDFATDNQGFVASDVDVLVRRGVITVIDDGVESDDSDCDRRQTEDDSRAAPRDPEALDCGMPIDFGRSALDAAGFEGWRTWDELRLSSFEGVPPGPCVYVVFRVATDEPSFLAESPAGRFKGQNPTVPIDVLRAAWVPGAQVVYVGKGSVGKRRLRQYAQYGAGRPVGHRGGRYIWQLVDAPDLLVAWCSVGNSDGAREHERRLLLHFADLHAGRLPFANLAR